MGAFLSIGVASNFKVAKRETDKVSLDKIIEKMILEIGFDADLYEIEETEYAWEWQIKTDKIQSDFVPFLEKFYSVLGKFARLDDADEVIQKLKTEQPSSLQAFIDEDSFYNFQESYSNESYDLYFEKSDSTMKDKIKISSDFITLASTGKIMMEETGGFFDFFEAMIHEYFKEYKLAKNLKVYISG